MAVKKHRKKRKRKPEPPIGLNKILTPDEEMRFMDYLVSVSGDPGGVQTCLIFDIMLQTGVRVSEMCGLRVKDMPKYMGGNVIRVHLGKGGRSRDIPVSQRIVRNVNKYIRDFRPSTLPPSVRHSDSRKKVFYSAMKKPFTRDGIAYKIEHLGRLAGIEKRLAPHMVRHTFATNALLDNKTTVPVLQALMGHSKISTTQRYIHTAGLLDTRLGKALDRGRWVL